MNTAAPVKATAVVFAYNNVGVRCLRVLLDQGVHVPLVLTHEDSATENIWYESVAQVCVDRGIEVITVDDPNHPDVVARIRALTPDFLFSFYYRKMLGADILGIPKRGALNMHGSLLPKYRGRVPTNWAVINGESETGASLHYMETKPDAGDLVAQANVPILGDDTAFEVFQKVVVAAEMTLFRALPQLIDGTAPRVPLDLKSGSYFSGRKPEDGRISWQQSAQQIYNLVRAVAPPYPGAFTDFDETRVILNKARIVDGASTSSVPGSIAQNGHTLGFVCADGMLLEPLSLTVNGKTLDRAASQSWLASRATK
ncbi:MAG: formyltransferase [Casimicrobium sp.]